MKTELIEKAYAVAKDRYAAVGVDTDAVLDQLQKQQISLHCWQTDDVVGFERNEALSGGIQTTGNYPGRARNIDEVRKDIEFVKTLIADNHRLNLHEIYGDFGNQFVDRDQVEVKHFQSWIDWAKENNMKLDFNSTSFSHPKSGNLTLSNPDKGIRDFWIEHTKRCRRIADAMGKAQNDHCIMNIWVHDGSKDQTVRPNCLVSVWRVIPLAHTTSIPPTAPPANRCSPSTQAIMSLRKMCLTSFPHCSCMYQS